MGLGTDDASADLLDPASMDASGSPTTPVCTSMGLHAHLGPHKPFDVPDPLGLLKGPNSVLKEAYNDYLALPCIKLISSEIKALYCTLSSYAETAEPAVLSKSSHSERSETLTEAHSASTISEPPPAHITTPGSGTVPDPLIHPPPPHELLLSEWRRMSLLRFSCLLQSGNHSPYPTQ
ncbi:uncharacterized protein EI90DRAFT_3125848 [Cantharellus anzutake]|uniref:uncharacterized protein n=1 Tax=Cantharellus anzutake TaxID=1750568 RepID=UPI0019072DC4|nr:uncharacterized protein EI90DRAFT_3125848 [Cantharellus anzutake]KAF8328717.1 hypothetical protein EI90DRAFT_3125848 [Cantharellus anzutake]